MDGRHTRTSNVGYPTGEIVGYGLLGAAVAGGVLYLDGQEPSRIAVVVGAILALLATLALIAPRLRVPIVGDGASPAPHRPAPADSTDAASPRPNPDAPGPPPAPQAEPPAATHAGPTAMPSARSGWPGAPSEPASAGAPSDPAGPGRSAKRGRRRR